MNARIRTAHEGDLPAIVDIYNAALASKMITLGSEPLSVPGRRAWFYDHTPCHPLWVAEVEDEVAGWLSFERFHKRPAYDITSEISVYVDPDFRGKKIGAQMIRAAVEYAPAVGLRRLVGLTMAANTRALDFFSQMGFQKWAQLPHVMELDGAERDLVIVGKRTV